MISLQKLSKNKPLLTVLLSVIVFLIVFLLSWTNVFYALNKSFQNNFYSLKSKVVSKDIVVVWIDERTLKELWRFPFSRDKYIPFIENLNEAWASVIALDVIFADKTEESIDDDFASAIKDSWNIVLWISFLPDGSFEEPIDIFKDAASGIWYFEPIIDRATNTVYSVRPNVVLSDKSRYEHFTIQVLKAYYWAIFDKDYSKTESKIKDNNYYVTDNIYFPLSRNDGKNLLINFVPASKFTEFSFIDIYDKSQLEPAIKAKWSNFSFNDKIVIVWATAKGLKDVFNTPNGLDYGIHVHANILNTILTKSYIKYFDKNIEWVLMFLLVIISTYFNLSKNSWILILSNIAVATIFIFIFPVYILVFTNLVLNYSSELIFTLVISLTVSNTTKYFIEDKNKSVLVKALSEYISKDIADKILGSTWDTPMEWEKKKVSIFFSDIAWFTTISEKFTPERLVSFLREYLSVMSNIIMDERWLIDKYEWDAIMALWGVFGYESSSSYDNCKSALLQQEKLKNLNIHLKQEYGEVLEVRMWLHTWDAIVWNIWAKWRKMEFTALWDSVNLASRLEGVNKFYGTSICVSETVKDEVVNEFKFRYLDKIRVKWKDKPIKIYELIWEEGKIDDAKLDIIKDFEKALGLYFKKEFKKAEQSFEKLSKLWDEPSKIFEKRCRDLSIKYELEIPRENWDWVWEMKEK